MDAVTAEMLKGGVDAARDWMHKMGVSSWKSGRELDDTTEVVILPLNKGKGGQDD